MGLIASMVVVNWAGLLPGTELNASVHNLGAAIQGARSDAVSRNGEFRLYYDLEQSSWWVLSPYRDDGTPARAEEERLIARRGFFPKSVVIQRITVGGQEFVEGVVYVSFDALGRATDHTVTLAHTSYNTVMTIEVLPLTGLVRFHEGLFERPTLEEGDF
jgi:Tfp pilus assembly protein FimT